MFRQALCAVAACAAFAVGASAVPVQISRASGVTGWNAATPTGDIADLLDANGDSTGFSLTTDNTNAFNPGSNNVAAASPGAPASDYFPSSVTNLSFFGHTNDFQGSTYPLAVWTFGGLDPSKSYDFIIFASRTSVSDNRETRYAFAGGNSATIDFNPSNNTTEIVQARGLTPTAGGEIVLSVSAGPNNNQSNRFFYLTAMRFEEVPEPASMLLLGAGSLMLVRRRR